ncbi:MAG: insulinase family protein, partial [Muribaculaceae bacterium]|nr:insulinase family protein [Muribaculaceae bacterium]
RIGSLELPTDTLTQRFPNGNPSQTAFDYLFFGRYEPGLRGSLVLKLMSNLLRNRIIAELREKRALVYSPYVGLSYEGKPRGYYYFDINSSADNANMPQVHEALLGVIARLRSETAAQSELDAIKRSCVIAKRETLNPYSPSAWRTTLTSLLKNGEALDDFDRYEAIIDSITPEEIREGFARYINPDLFVLLYMSDSEVRLK